MERLNKKTIIFILFLFIFFVSLSSAQAFIGFDVCDNSSGCEDEDWSVSGLNYVYDIETVGTDVYVGLWDSTVRKFNYSGDQQWSFTKGGSFTIDVEIDEQGFAYRGGFDGYVRKIDSAGSEVALDTCGTISDDVFDVETSENETLCSAKNGVVRKWNTAGTTTMSSLWSVNTLDGNINKVKFDNDRNVIVGSQDGSLYKLNGSDGSIIWHYDNALNLVSEVYVLDDNSMYISGQPNLVKKIDSDGNEVWSNSNHSGNVNFFVVDDQDNIYTAGSDGTIKKINATGSVVWSESGLISGSIPVIDIDNQSNIYVGSGDNTVRKLNSDGDLSWTFEGHSTDIVSLSIDDNYNVFSGDDNGNLFKIIQQPYVAINNTAATSSDNVSAVCNPINPDWSVFTTLYVNGSSIADPTYTYDKGDIATVVCGVTRPGDTTLSAASQNYTILNSPPNLVNTTSFQIKNQNITVSKDGTTYKTFSQFNNDYISNTSISGSSYSVNNGDLMMVYEDEYCPDGRICFTTLDSIYIYNFTSDSQEKLNEGFLSENHSISIDGEQIQPYNTTTYDNGFNLLKKWFVYNITGNLNDPYNVFHEDDNVVIKKPSYNDIDGDSTTIEYQWYVNNVTNSSLNTSTLDSSNINAGDSVYLRYRGYDGTNHTDYNQTITKQILGTLDSSTVTTTPTNTQFPEIGDNMVFNASLNSNYNLDYCVLNVVSKNNSNVNYTSSNISVSGKNVFLSENYVVEDKFNGENMNVTSFYECTDVNNNTGKTESKNFSIKDLTKPSFTETGSSPLLTQGSFITPSTQEEYPLNITFQDPNLFQVSAEITCDISGRHYYFEKTGLNTTSYTLTDTIDLSEIQLEECALKLQSSDSHTAVEIPEYDSLELPNGLSYVTDNDVQINVTSEESLSGVDTNKLSDRYNFEFEYTDNKLIRKYIIETSHDLYYIPESEYPAHFVAWNEDTNTGNWIDFALPNSDEYYYIINKLEDNSYEIYIIHKSLQDPDNTSMFTQKDTSFFNSLINFFTAEQPVEKKDIGSFKSKKVIKNRSLTTKELINLTGIKNITEAQQKALENAFGINNIKFNSVGTTNVLEEEYTFYGTGSFKITSINQYDNSGIQNYTVKITDTNNNSNTQTQTFQNSTSILNNVDKATYEVNITHPDFLNKNVIKTMEQQYHECIQNNANETIDCQLPVDTKILQTYYDCLYSNCDPLNVTSENITFTAGDYFYGYIKTEFNNNITITLNNGTIVEFPDICVLDDNNGEMYFQGSVGAPDAILCYQTSGQTYTVYNDYEPGNFTVTLNGEKEIEYYSNNQSNVNVENNNDFMNIANFFDNNKSSYANVLSSSFTDIYFNYSAPNVSDVATWEVTAFDGASSTNIEFDIRNESFLQLRIRAKQETGNNNIKFQKYNGSSWNDLSFTTTKFYDSKIYEEEMRFYTPIENQIDISYNSSQAESEFKFYDVKTRSLINNYTVNITDQSTLQTYNYNITNGDEYLDLKLNANTTYTVEFFKDKYIDYAKNFSYDYKTTQTEEIYVGYYTNLSFIDEQTLEPFNFSNPNNVQLKIICQDDSVFYDLNSSEHQIPITCEYDKFRYILSYPNAVTYYRNLIPEHQNSFKQEVYLIDATETPYIYTTVALDDLMGRFEDASIHIKKKLPNGTVTIHSDFTDFEDKVGSYYIENDEYILEVHSSNRPIQIIGDYVADVSENKVISLYDINLDSNPTGRQQNVQYTIKTTNQSGTNSVLFSYSDAEDNTEELKFVLYEDAYNGTVIYESDVFEDTSSVGSLLIPITGYENSSLVGAIEYVHSVDGSDEFVNVVNQNWNNQLPLAKHEDQANINWFFLLLLSVLAIFATITTSGMITIIVAAMAVLFELLGWFQVSRTVAIVALLIAIIDFMLRKKGER